MITFSQRQRITLDVVTGAIPPANESLEMAEVRRIAVLEIEEINANGGMVSYPNDWDVDESEATVEAGEPSGSGGIPCGDSFISADKECKVGGGTAGGAGRDEENWKDINYYKGKLVDFDHVKEFAYTKVGPHGMLISIGPKLNDGLRAFAVIDAGSHPAFQAGSDGFVNEETWKTWQSQTAPPPPVPEGHHPSGLKKLTLVENSTWKNVGWAQARTALITSYEDAAAKGDTNFFASNKPAAFDKPPDKLLSWDKRVMKAWNTASAQAGAKATEAAKPKPDDILSVETWKKVGGSLGTNPGGTYTDDGGKKWYVKQGYSDAHARNEVLAAELYKAAGISVMSQQLVKFKDGSLGVAHPWTDDLKPFDVKDSAQHASAKAGFAAHAWLANWDAVGAHPQNGVVNHNLAIIGGAVTGVETGGAMQYGGLGAAKPFGNLVTEWTGLRDPKTNPSMTKVFGAMSDSELAASAFHVAAVPDSVVRELVKKYGPTNSDENKALSDTLISRKYSVESEGAKHNEQAKLASVSLPLTPPGDSTGKVVFPPPPHTTAAHAQSKKSIADIQKAMATGHPENVDGVRVPAAHNPGSTLSKVHEWKAQVLAIMQADQKLAVATGTVAAPAASVFKPSALAAPPVIQNVAQGKQYQPMFNAVHNAASTMSQTDALNVIMAMPSNPNSKVTWGKKFHDYKMQAIAVVGEGKVVAPIVSVKTAVAAAPKTAPAPKPVFDPAKLPAPPAYTASSKQHVNDANTATMKTLYEAAKGGDKNNLLSQKFAEIEKESGKLTGNLKSFSEHPAAPVKNYYNELVGNIHDQLNPPPPPPPALHSSFLPEVAHQFGVDTVTFKGKKSDAGRWIILDNKTQPTYQPGSILTEKWLDDDVFLDSSPGHKGVFQPLPQSELDKHAASASKLPANQANAVSHYKGSNYDAINTSLASGKPSSEAVAAAKGVFAAAVEIPEGKWLSRNFTLSGQSVESIYKEFKSTEGHVVQDPVLGSTATAKDIFQNTVKLYMKVGPGVKALRGVSSESELILPPNTRMVIDRVKKVGTSHVFIFAYLLPTLATQCCGHLKSH